MRRDVLLLQGPIGPFFSRLSEDLESRGFVVWKINLNGGDRFFYPRERSIDYTGSLDDWMSYLQRFIHNRDIGRIYLFGDCRAYHRIAREVAELTGVRLFVFEEGYIRPNFVTLEEGGVNGHSPMLKNPIPLDRVVGDVPKEMNLDKETFMFMSAYSMLYYWACAIHSRKFLHYRHHRPLGWLSEGVRWIRSATRKLIYKSRERHILKELLAQYESNYFICPLQVHCDMQVVVHSGYNSIEHFIGDVLCSFAEHAPKNKAIVFKHHPLDRAYTDYTTLIANLSAELGLQDRVFYIHDIDLPTLLSNAQGTVLINSTVGLSSLFHGTPVKALGQAIYDAPGLTEQGALEDFWQQPQPVDGDKFIRFRSNLVLRNQLNGNLYRRLESGSACGIRWSEELSETHVWHENRPERGVTPRLNVVTGTGGTVRRVSKDDSRAA